MGARKREHLALSHTASSIRPAHRERRAYSAVASAGREAALSGSEVVAPIRYPNSVRYLSAGGSESRSARGTLVDAAIGLARTKISAARNGSSAEAWWMLITAYCTADPMFIVGRNWIRRPAKVPSQEWVQCEATMLGIVEARRALDRSNCRVKSEMQFPGVTDSAHPSRPSRVKFAPIRAPRQAWRR